MTSPPMSLLPQTTPGLAAVLSTVCPAWHQFIVVGVKVLSSGRLASAASNSDVDAGVTTKLPESLAVPMKVIIWLILMTEL